MMQMLRSRARRLLDGWVAQTTDRSLNVRRVPSVDQCNQLLLGMQYRELLTRGGPLPGFQDVEFRSYSQNGEDGILLYLFSLLGHGSRRAVEICAGDGIECNTANLIINHGWTGLLVDGNPESIARGREFYARCPTTFVYPPTLVQAWVTAEGVDALLAEHGFTGEIDLLSLDLDGVDYWIWRAIRSIRPRVVVLECHTGLGAERSVTVPYREDFRQAPEGSAGASLRAFVKLGAEKGYRLVGCQRYGFNAFFLRDDVGADLFPTARPEDCLRHPHVARVMAVEGRRPNPTWIEV